MCRSAVALGLCLLVVPVVAAAQGSVQGTTQSRDGLGDGAHPTRPANSVPAGSENATSGPQATPAYPSGSSTPNPGAAFVRDQPAPAAGALASPPGTLSTTTTLGGAATTRPGGTGQEGAAPLPPK